MPQTKVLVSSEKRWWALWTLVLSFFMIMMDSTIVSIATPKLMEHFGAGVNTISWVTNAYLLAYAVPILLAGRLGDILGADKIFILGMLIFTVSSLGCAMATSVSMLIFARVLQGIGGAIMTPQTMAIITKIFSPVERPKAMSPWGATAGVALLVGPLLGGVLTDNFNWRWIFLINVPLGLIALLMAFRFLPKLDKVNISVDYLGALLSGLGIFLVVYAIQEGETYHWSNIWGPIKIWHLIILGVLFIVGFFFYEKKLDQAALIPIKLFNYKNFVVACACIAIMGAVMTSLSIPSNLFTQSVGGFTPTKAALLMAPMALISMLMAPIVAKMIHIFSTRWLVVGGLLGTGIALFITAKMMTPHQNIWLFMLPFALLGFSTSLIWSPLANTATRELKIELVGAGSGVYNMIRQVGAVIGSAITVAVMRSTLTNNFGNHAEQVGVNSGPVPDFIKPGFSEATANAIYFTVVLTVVGFVTAFALKDIILKEEVAVPEE